MPAPEEASTPSEELATAADSSTGGVALKADVAEPGADVRSEEVVGRAAVSVDEDVMDGLDAAEFPAAAADDETAAAADDALELRA